MPNLGVGCVTIGIGHDDPTRHTVQGPCGATVSGSVKHEVDVLRVASAVAYAPLKETIDEAVAWIDSKPVTRVDAACGCSRLVINREVGRVDAVGNRNPHIGPTTEVVVGGVHVVLRCSRWVPVYQEPGLIAVSEARWDKVIGHLRDTSNDEPVPCCGTCRVRARSAKDVKAAIPTDKEGARHLIVPSIIDGLITGTATCGYTGRGRDCKLLGPNIPAVGGMPQGRICPPASGKGRHNDLARALGIHCYRRFAIVKGIGVRQIGISITHDRVNNKTARNRQKCPYGAWGQLLQERLTERRV